MTDSNFWAVAGPLIALVGVVLVVRGARHRSSTGTARDLSGGGWTLSRRAGRRAARRTCRASDRSRVWLVSASPASSPAAACRNGSPGSSLRSSSAIRPDSPACCRSATPSATTPSPGRSRGGRRARTGSTSAVSSRPRRRTRSPTSSALPQTSLVRDFQCVTGWRVPEVHWSGVRLAELLDRAEPSPSATAVAFHSFDGTYTESLTLDQARRSDVLVALQMLGKPVTHDHGGPVRMYVAPMYGYKSTKWLSGDRAHRRRRARLLGTHRRLRRRRLDRYVERARGRAR